MTTTTLTTRTEYGTPTLTLVHAVARPGRLETAILYAVAARTELACLASAARLTVVVDTTRDRIQIETAHGTNTEAEYAMNVLREVEAKVPAIIAALTE